MWHLEAPGKQFFILKNKFLEEQPLELKCVYIYMYINANFVLLHVQMFLISAFPHLTIIQCLFNH